MRCVWHGILSVQKAWGMPICTVPPDPINHVYSLPGKYMSQKYFTSPSVQIFKILFRGFYFQKSNKNLILRTRPCGTAFIHQHSWLLHFRQAEICLVEMICTAVVPTSKGICANMAEVPGKTRVQGLVFSRARGWEPNQSLRTQKTVLDRCRKSLWQTRTRWVGNNSQITVTMFTLSPR